LAYWLRIAYVLRDLAFGAASRSTCLDMKSQLGRRLDLQRMDHPLGQASSHAIETSVAFVRTPSGHRRRQAVGRAHRNVFLDSTKKPCIVRGSGSVTNPKATPQFGSLPPAAALAEQVDKRRAFGPPSPQIDPAFRVSRAAEDHLGPLAARVPGKYKQDCRLAGCPNDRQRRLAAIVSAYVAATRG